jgi:Protein of unknown function (DUF3237)
VSSSVVASCDLPTNRKAQLIYLKYNGVIDITPDLGAILSGRPDAKSTDFGDACKLCRFLRGLNSLMLFTVIHLVFETGNETYRALETGVYVGAGRFVVGKDRPVFVEYKVCRIVSGGTVETNTGPSGSTSSNGTT